MALAGIQYGRHRAAIVDTDYNIGIAILKAPKLLNNLEFVNVAGTQIQKYQICFTHIILAFKHILFWN